MADFESQPGSPSSSNSGISPTVRFIIIALVLTVIGLGIALFFSVQKSSETEAKVASLVTTNEELETEIEKLETEIKKMDQDLASANKTAEEKSEELKKLQAKIAGYMSQIDRLTKDGKIAAAERDKFMGKYNQLEYYNEKYRKQIAELEAEIARLKQENESLRTRVDSTSQQLEQVRTDNQSMNTQLQLAKLLIASDFDYAAINKRGKSMEPDEIRAKRIKTLQVRFVLNRNPVASPVTKDIFVLIQEPSGQVYFSPATSSGYFTLNGQKTTYSAKKTVRYDGTRQDVTVDYVVPEDAPLKSGRHTVNVYTSYENSEEVYLLGQHRFDIK
jgi:uncharacterized protein YlxW (UPF0749 family)